MTAANILIYVALIGYVLFKKVQGQPLKAPKRLFALPIVLIVIGYGDLAHGAALKPVQITLTVVAALLSLGLGALRGRADKLSTRNGRLIMQWGALSLALFVGNLAAKLALDLIAVAAGGTAGAAGKSLIFTLGLTLFAEAVVLFIRSGGATELLGAQPRGTAEPPARQRGATPAREVGDALARHHERHEERRRGHRHDRGHRHGRDRS